MKGDSTKKSIKLEESDDINEESDYYDEIDEYEDQDKSMIKSDSKQKKKVSLKILTKIAKSNKNEVLCIKIF
jgi:hypothetical protein